MLIVYATVQFLFGTHAYKDGTMARGSHLQGTESVR